MKRIILLLSVLFCSCAEEKRTPERSPFTSVAVDMLLQDSMSIRAIEVMGEDVGFAGSDAYYGLYSSAQDKVKLSQQTYDSIFPEYRAVASNGEDFFLLSVANPALLFKTGDAGQMELVYQEVHPDVFYDSMTFWNAEEGIAMGDPTEGCLSVIITRDAGHSWKKVSCDLLPATVAGEAAFAASDTNIATVGDSTWILSGGQKSRVFFSPDKGKSWEVFSTPLTQGSPTTGGYSMDFYDAQRGVIIGGDYTAPEQNAANKAVTSDGGKTWKLVARNQPPGYKSCVQYVPGRNAQQLVAVGFSGISYSSDSGKNWRQLSEEGFYTLRFVNDSVAYAAGKNKLARLVFK